MNKETAPKQSNGEVYFNPDSSLSIDNTLHFNWTWGCDRQKDMHKSLGILRNSVRQKHREPSHQITQKLLLLLRAPPRFDQCFLPCSKNSDLRFKFFKDMGSDSTWEMRTGYSEAQQRRKNMFYQGRYHLILLTHCHEFSSVIITCCWWWFCYIVFCNTVNVH